MELAIISRPYIFPYRTGYRIAKRVMDLILVLLALPALLPLTILCMLAVRLDSPGPVFFIQERVGKGGRRFRIYKFRTMYHNLDNSAHKTFMRAFVNGEIGKNGTGKTIYKPFRESQVTRAGRILRKTSLDELPQLINVLKGEMSLVGPRPNVPWEVEEYRGWHKERLEVLPGITGLAQVNGRSGVDFDTIVGYDVEYIRRQSLGLDLQILWQTMVSVIGGQGAH
jgi:lipopolysaccharide/colanic/teichoic acid biosynthesis glycosyltransferase